MVYLVFGHTAVEPPLCIGPLPSFRVAGALILDHQGRQLAQHNGARWVVEGQPYYRMDCEGPVTVELQPADGHGARKAGPFSHFSLFNGTAYASRDLFAHYREQEDCWYLYEGEARCASMMIQPV